MHSYAIINYLRSRGRGSEDKAGASSNSRSIDASELHRSYYKSKGNSKSKSNDHETSMQCEYLTTAPTRAEFLQRVASNRPFVVKRMASDWGAVSRWSLDYMLQRMGNDKVSALAHE